MMNSLLECDLCVTIIGGVNTKFLIGMYHRVCTLDYEIHLELCIPKLF